MFIATRLIHLDKEAIYNMIYPLAAFENCKLSYKDFKNILEDGNDADYDAEDVLFVRNLEEACTYMLDTLNEQVSVDYAYRLNEILTKGRIEGQQKRDYEISVEDLEYIKILNDCDQDLSSYELHKILPGIPEESALDEFMNISKETYQTIVANFVSNHHEGFAYNCFMPMIKAQYFKKSNIITGALIVSKLVLKAESHLMFIEPKHKEVLAKALLDCIYYNYESPFNQFIDVMIAHRVEILNETVVKVMIHY